MTRCLSLVAAAFLAAPAAAQQPRPKLTDAKVVTADHVYKTTPEGELVMHGFFPADWKPTDKRPVVVLFFGGGWKSGSFNQFVPQSEYFASRGIVALAADYRILSKHKALPDKCVEDAKSAVRWVRANAAKLGIDPEKVIAGGGSAGGHLAAATALVTKFNATDDPKISSVPNALVLWNPFLNGKGREFKGTDGTDIAEAISPTLYLAKDTPPAVLFYGTADAMIEQGREYVAKAKSLGVRAELWTAEGQPHAFFNRGPWLSATTRKADEFLTSLGYLSGGPTLKLEDPAKDVKRDEPAAKPGAAKPAAKLPNVVYILADDLGYGDVKCLNPAGKIATPHMDRLAAAGMVFTDSHSPSAVCSPTRYGVITGRYAWRGHLKSGVLGGLSPRLIEQGRLTVPQLLKDHGYHTACIGKWHLGMDWELKPGKAVSQLNIEPREQVFNVEYGRPIANGPNAVGFDYYFGISASLDMVPYTFIENDRVTALPTEDRDFPLFLGRAQGRCRKGPAAPGFAAEDVLPKLTDTAVGYIAKRAKEPAPFFLYLPLASPHTPVLPKKEWQGKAGGGLNFYADFVSATDDAVGRVLKALDDAGVADNTLVVLTSDNGCSPQADFPALIAKGHNPSHVFRGTKADIFEGGHRVPFIARWPGKVAPGSKTDALAVHTDLLATCADVVGAKLPPTAGEDSVSLFPALGLSKTAPRDSVIVHSINGSFAIREKNWKLCLCPGSGGWSTPRPGKDDAANLPPVQLFDLSTDIGEKVNLHERHPEVVARLTKRLEAEAAAGRSTPGAPQPNTAPVDVWKAGKAAPPKKK